MSEPRQPSKEECLTVLKVTPAEFSNLQALSVGAEFNPVAYDVYLECIRIRLDVPRGTPVRVEVSYD